MISNKVAHLPKYLSLLILSVLVMACADDTKLILKKDTDFFPVQVGGYFVYDVEETKYTAIDGQEDFLYQSKITVTDSFKNNVGGTTYVLQLSIKNEGESQFEYQNTWSVRIEPSQVVVSEGNTSYIRLAFPVSTGRQWNGNALNTLGGEESCGDDSTFSCDIYEIGDIGFQFDLNGDILDETVEVIQNNNADLIVKQDVRREIYARNIGLVYKESTILEYCTVGSCIGQQQIEKGVILKQTLNSYGKE
ncbi:MAG: hypothetical protein RIF39_10370 [Cyclobacteriaceae bacterium]